MLLNLTTCIFGSETYIADNHFDQEYEYHLIPDKRVHTRDETTFSVEGKNGGKNWCYFTVMWHLKKGAVVYKKEDKNKKYRLKTNRQISFMGGNILMDFPQNRILLYKSNISECSFDGVNETDGKKIKIECFDMLGFSPEINIELKISNSKLKLKDEDASDRIAIFKQQTDNTYNLSPYFVLSNDVDRKKAVDTKKGANMFYVDTSMMTKFFNGKDKDDMFTFDFKSVGAENSFTFFKKAESELEEIPSGEYDAEKQKRMKILMENCENVFDKMVAHIENDSVEKDEFIDLTRKMNEIPIDVINSELQKELVVFQLLRNVYKKYFCDKLKIPYRSINIKHFIEFWFTEMIKAIQSDDLLFYYQGMKEFEYVFLRNEGCRKLVFSDVETDVLYGLTEYSKKMLGFETIVLSKTSNKVECGEIVKLTGEFNAAYVKMLKTDSIGDTEIADVKKKINEIERKAKNLMGELLVKFNLDFVKKLFVKLKERHISSDDTKKINDCEKNIDDCVAQINDAIKKRETNVETLKSLHTNGTKCKDEMEKYRPKFKQAQKDKIALLKSELDKLETIITGLGSEVKPKTTQKPKVEHDSKVKKDHKVTKDHKTEKDNKPEKDSDSKMKTSTIVIIVISSVFGAILIVFVIYCLLKKRRYARATKEIK